MKRESRSIPKFGSKIIKTLATLFDTAPNSTYDSYELGQTIMKMGMGKNSAKRQSKPSPDVILNRLHEVDEEKARLLFTEREKENGKEIHPFITNLDMGPDEGSENYRWCWRIETHIRELEKFKPFTTSQSMSLRRLYFLVSMTLYNLWILFRNGEERPRAHEFKRRLKPLLTVFRVFRKEKSRPPPVPTLA